MTILFFLMKEKNYYSDLRHDPITVLSSQNPNLDSDIQLYSINDIRNAIGTGKITNSADLATCYNTMLDWSEYPSYFPIIGFSLMYFIPGTSTIPTTTTPADS